MPLMRIRSVEIVFEEEMSASLLDRSVELLLSDSDDSTKCVDDLEHSQPERDENDSVTLNADADLSDDNSYSPKRAVNVPIPDDARERNESLALGNDDTLSLNISELGDSGRFTEEASSSRIEVPIVTYDDAALSRSFDAVHVDESSTIQSMCEASELGGVNAGSNRLYEYIDSDSDGSDSTAVCDDDTPGRKPDPDPDPANPVDPTDPTDPSYELQYDSFVDIGKF